MGCCRPRDETTTVSRMCLNLIITVSVSGDLLNNITSSVCCLSETYIKSTLTPKLTSKSTPKLLLVLIHPFVLEYIKYTDGDVMCCDATEVLH